MALLPLLGLGAALRLDAPAAPPQPHVLHIIADDYGASALKHSAPRQTRRSPRGLGG
jgi:hypothetical protein|eukprot:COSAG01_NODE_27247_length_690_cov_1.786802_1_plen_57_part_00